MGLRQRIVDLLSKGAAPEADPDEIVDVGTVALAEGPLTIESLREAGIEATMIEAFDAPTAITRARIMVRRHDAAAASEVLAASRSSDET
ncbi:MAG TPA: hypothetical protein VFY82_01240 [Acidimicrobiales bacterium]|nr:hypothetical protein [Acidimicrobiales bacterium]